MAEAQIGNGRLRHRDNQTQPGPFRQSYDRHGLRLRCGASLDERAGIRVPLGHYSAEGSGNAGVRFKRCISILVGFGHGTLALGFRERGPSAADLSFGFLIVGQRVIEFLLSNQPRASL